MFFSSPGQMKREISQEKFEGENSCVCALSWLLAYQVGAKVDLPGEIGRREGKSLPSRGNSHG
jgi:hypothetical protein